MYLFLLLLSFVTTHTTLRHELFVTLVFFQKHAQNRMDQTDARIKAEDRHIFPLSTQSGKQSTQRSHDWVRMKRSRL